MKTRRFLTSLAAKLPPRHVTDRIIPWAALFASLLGGAWALASWRSDLQVRRVEATLEFLVLYQERFDPEVGTYAKSLAAFEHAQGIAVVEARCAAATAAARGSALVSPGLAAFDCADLGSESRDASFAAMIQEAGQWADMRDAIREELAPRVAEIAASGEHSFIAAEITFLHALARCVDRGNCDEPTAAALFYGPIVRALNDSCRRGGEALQPHDPRYVLTDLVLRNNAFERMRATSSDRGQANPFLCPETRQMAN
jgi:hypothetical protein